MSLSLGSNRERNQLGIYFRDGKLTVIVDQLNLAFIQQIFEYFLCGKHFCTY